MSGSWNQTSLTGGSFQITANSTTGFADELLLDANAGLSVATTALAPVKATFPGISFADIYTLAASAAANAALPPSQRALGNVSWCPGRVDMPSGQGANSNALLPTPNDAWINSLQPSVTVGDKPSVAGGAGVGDQTNGVSAASNYTHSMSGAVLRSKFGATMGFSDQEIVALMGAHGLGRMHPSSTGFDLSWVPPAAGGAAFSQVNAGTQFGNGGGPAGQQRISITTLSNAFYVMLVGTSGPSATSSAHAGAFLQNWFARDHSLNGSGSSAGLRATSNQAQFDRQNARLPTDLVLITDPQFLNTVALYASNNSRFLQDFVAVYSKLLALGCGTPGRASCGTFAQPCPGPPPPAAAGLPQSGRRNLRQSSQPASSSGISYVGNLWATTNATFASNATAAPVPIVFWGMAGFTYNPITVPLFGSSIAFSYTSGLSNVYQLKSAAALQSCDFSNAVVVGRELPSQGSRPGDVVTTFTGAQSAGTYYFASNVSNQCNSANYNVRIAVTVIDPSCPTPPCATTQTLIELSPPYQVFAIQWMEFATSLPNAGVAQSVRMGVVLEFVLPSQELSIWKLASQDAYNNCDFTGATQIRPLQGVAFSELEQQVGYMAPGVGASNVMWIPPAPGLFYFASGLPFYCSVYNLKVNINVVP